MAMSPALKTKLAELNELIGQAESLADEINSLFSEEEIDTNWWPDLYESILATNGLTPDLEDDSNDSAHLRATLGHEE